MAILTYDEEYGILAGLESVTNSLMLVRDALTDILDEIAMLRDEVEMLDHP